MPKVVVSVRNEDQLRGAAIDSGRREIEIVIAEAFPIRSTVDFPRSLYNLRITSIPKNIIESMQTFTKWDADRIRHMWQFGPRPGVICEGLTIVGYNGGGQVIRAGTEPSSMVVGVKLSVRSFELIGCQFADIGNERFPYRRDVVENSDDVHYSCVIGGVSDWFLYDTVFMNCGAGSGYSHCIYPLIGSNLDVARSEIKEGGNHLTTTYCETVRIVDSRFTAGNVFNDKQARILAPWFFDFGAQRRVVLRKNKLIGKWLRYGLGVDTDFLPNYDSDNNDFSRASFEDFVNIQIPSGVSSKDMWMRHGQDTGSKFK